MKSYEESAAAWHRNKQLSDNPYQFGTPDYDSWRDGWNSQKYFCNNFEKW